MGGAPEGGTARSWLQGTCRVAGAHVKAGNCVRKSGEGTSVQSKRAQRGAARAVNDTSPSTLPEKAVMTMLRVLMASEWPFHVGQIGSVPCARVQAVSAALRNGLRAAHVEPLLLRVLRQVVHAAL